MVAGRLCGDEFRCLTDSRFPYPPGLPADLFIDIPEFRLDISSTELRLRKAAAAAAASATAAAASVSASASASASSASGAGAAGPRRGATARGQYGEPRQERVPPAHEHG
jgi:hypothetical protein